MKRFYNEIESINMANVLMLLSRGDAEQTTMNRTDDLRVFECKTCNRQFPSFQALGGHRASHKKPRIWDANNQDRSQSAVGYGKPKVHECSICGLEFAIGQALGGHMRRHRAVANEGFVEKITCNNGKRVMLDLNLPPLDDETMDTRKLELGIGMEFVEKAPMVDCFQ